MNALLESLTGCVLQEPWFLALLAVVPLALRAWRRDPSVLFAPAALLDDGFPPTWRTRLAWVPRAAQALGLVLLVVAMARPVRRDRIPLETEGIDIVLCLDTSSSMTTDDMDARRTRLVVAEDAAARFVEARRNDRIGLVSFARYPDLRCPPTLDHAALRTILAGLSTVESDGAEDATGIGTAVASAAQVLTASDAKSKVVVLLTDGAENVATAKSPGEIAPLHAAQLCKQLGVRVYAIVAGPSGGKADTSQVEALAARTGGKFFLAGDAAAVDEVYASIDALEKADLAEPRYRVEERFAPFVLAAVVSLLAGTLLRLTVGDVLP